MEKKVYRLFLPSKLYQIHSIVFFSPRITELHLPFLSIILREINKKDWDSWRRTVEAGWPCPIDWNIHEADGKFVDENWQEVLVGVRQIACYFLNVIIVLLPPPPQIWSARNNFSICHRCPPHGWKWNRERERERKKPLT